MRSLQLSASKNELLQALRILGTHRRRRGTSVVPVWLRYNDATGELTIAEDRGAVAASVSAIGAWPAAGATVSLFMLRGAAANSPERVELHAIEDAVVIPTVHAHVRLDLIAFGPKAVGRAPERQSGHQSDLPLFRRRCGRDS